MTSGAPDSRPWRPPECPVSESVSRDSVWEGCVQSRPPRGAGPRPLCSLRRFAVLLQRAVRKDFGGRQLTPRWRRSVGRSFGLWGRRTPRGCAESGGNHPGRDGEKPLSLSTRAARTPRAGRSGRGRWRDFKRQEPSSAAVTQPPEETEGSPGGPLSLRTVREGEPSRCTFRPGSLTWRICESPRIKGGRGETVGHRALAITCHSRVATAGVRKGPFVVVAAERF